MHELGFDLSEAKPKLLDPAVVARADRIITMGCDVEGVSRIDEDWGLPDPKGQSLERVREIRDLVRDRASDLAARLAQKRHRLIVLTKAGEALLLAGGMLWQVAWSLILGFTLSGAVQALVSKQKMQAVLGRDGIREIAIATGFGAASSSCSYAAAAMSKTLFKKAPRSFPAWRFSFRRRTWCSNSG